jgi:hypothetical protein
MRFWARWSAWLCLSLMLWTAAAESTHKHPSQTESASCSICLAAHTASPTVSAVQGAPVFAAIGLLHEEDTVLKARFNFFERGIRGPPAIL